MDLRTCEKFAKDADKAVERWDRVGDEGDRDNLEKMYRYGTKLLVDTLKDLKRTADQAAKGDYEDTADDPAAKLHFLWGTYGFDQFPHSAAQNLSALPRMDADQLAGVLSGLVTLFQKMFEALEEAGFYKVRLASEAAQQPRERLVWGRRAADFKLSDDKQSRFEEGKPADPTENMSAADAAKWKAENAKHKDKFKSARSVEASGWMVGWTWDRRMTEVMDSYAKEIAAEAADHLMDESVTITSKSGVNYVEGTDVNNQRVSVTVTPAGWGVMQMRVSRGNRSKTMKAKLGGTDAKMVAGEAIYGSGLF